MTDGTFTELQTLINNASSEDTIILTKNYKQSGNNDAGGIGINKALTIDGNGHTIDGDFEYGRNEMCDDSLFTIENVNITLQNITFKHGNATLENDMYGGAIKIKCNRNAPFTINIINCIFIDNYAEEAGAAIGYQNVCSTNYNLITLNITNSHFIHNILPIEGRRYGGAWGSSVIHTDQYSDDDLSIIIDNCFFYNNIDFDDGIMNCGNISISNSIFYKNCQQNNDGILTYCYNSTDTGTHGATLINCQWLTQNQFKATLSGALIELGELIATNLTSMGVTSLPSNGLMTLSDKVLNIEPSVAELELDLNLTLTSSSYSISTSDNITLTSKLTAGYDDTSQINIDLDAVLTGATILFKEGNTTLGTGITNSNGIATAIISGLTDGTHTIKAIFEGTNNFDSCDSSNISVEAINDGTFTELQALIDNTASGGILTLTKSYKNAGDEPYLTTPVAMTIDGDGHFIDADGVSRIFDSIKANTIFENLTFKNGYQMGETAADSNGGAVRVTVNNVQFNNCTFLNNTANRGGAIYTTKKIIVNNCTFTDNQAITGVNNNYGGAIYITSGGASSIIKNSTFTENSALYAGGVYYATDLGATAPSIEYCTFDSNVSTHSTPHGGAMYRCNAVGCTFETSTDTTYSSQVNNTAIVYWNTAAPTAGSSSAYKKYTFTINVLPSTATGDITLKYRAGTSTTKTTKTGTISNNKVTFSNVQIYVRSSTYVTQEAYKPLLGYLGDGTCGPISDTAITLSFDAAASGVLGD